MARTKVTINRSAVIRVVGPKADQAAYRAAQTTRGRAVSNIRQLGRVDTGAMITNLQVRKAAESSPLDARYEVSSPVKHTRFQEFGTKAHGPARAPFMVFTPKGGGRVVFAKWVRGVTAGRFLRNAIEALRTGDFTK